MITTDIIASLVAKAWPLSVTPVNIMSGFKKIGAFPLNPGEVTDRYLAPSKALYKPQNESLDSSSASNASSPRDNSLPEKRKFTPEQCKLYEMRFSEGYDLPDADYMAWLLINHPDTLSDSAPDSLVTHLSALSFKSDPLSSISDPLSEVLSLPKPSDMTKKQRKKPGLNRLAVTITDEDVLIKIKEKQEEKIRKEAEKERKKLARDEKSQGQKKSREKGKNHSRHQQAIQHQEFHFSATEVSDEELVNEDGDDGECHGCNIRFKDDSSKWLCCDSCDYSYCFKCTGLKRVPKQFFCSECST